MGSRSKLRQLPLTPPTGRKTKARSGVKGGAVQPPRKDVGGAAPLEKESDKFVRMGGAMQEALERMRAQWVKLTAVRDWLEQWRGTDEEMFTYHVPELAIAIRETEAVAAILLHGLKARQPRGLNR